MWTSPVFFHCPRLYPVVTVRSESLSSCPQSQQLSDLIILLIQLSKQRQRVTEQAIPSKTQLRKARNHLTRAPIRRLKFLPHEHTLHTPPCVIRILHTLGHMTSTRHTCLLRFTYYNVSPRVTSHYHVITRHPLTWPDHWPLTLNKSKYFNRTCLAQFFA